MKYFSLSVPEYLELPDLQKNNTDAIINWSTSFRLNGELSVYEVYVDEQLVFRGVSTSWKQPLTSKGQSELIVRDMRCSLARDT